MMSNSIVALIPARSGSTRVHKKNIKKLGEHPLIAYTINTAIKSGIYQDVIVSTEDSETAEVAKYYGANVPFLRPEKYAATLSPDIGWVEDLITRHYQNARPQYFAILRPTNPFRTTETLKRAYELILSHPEAESLRAVEKCQEHPYKMWTIEKGYLKSLFTNPDKTSTPWHSRAYQDLPEIYVQNASLDLCQTKVMLQKKKITGDPILPFVTEGLEGFDINFPLDWLVAETILEKQLTPIEDIPKKPYPG